VHTGIGTTCTRDFNSCVCDLCYGLFEALLYANTGTLALPAVVRSAVILYANRYAQSGR
jgi:hypothetical protein